MPKSIESLVSFSAGEWSPTLTSRVDQQKYRSACIQLRNALALKTGPATRRPGTEFKGKCKVIPGGDYCARTEEFQYSVDTTFMLEWGNNYVRFYSNGAQVQVNVATLPFWNEAVAYKIGDFVQHDSLPWYCIAPVTVPVSPPPFNPLPQFDPTHWVQQSIYEVPTPYNALVTTDLPSTEVYQLTFTPINDEIYICHPKHPRAKLVRFADVNWVYQVVLDLVPPLLDENATDTTISASATSGSTNLTASAPTWLTGIYYDIGSSVIATTTAGSFVIGQTYIIASIGTTDFTLIGAASNTVGLQFVATGFGSPGTTGTATAIYVCTFPNVSGDFQTDLAAGKWQQTTIFQPLHVGAFWELAYLRGSTYVEYDGDATTGFAAGTSATITAFGAWEVHSYGVWSADVEIQASANGGETWETVRKITGRNDRNVDVDGTAVQARLYRIVVSNVAEPPTMGVTAPRLVFECVDAFLYGIVQITAVTDAYHATANVITQLTVADQWVSGTAYSVGDRVGYNGVNYICTTATSGSTAPPSDPSEWNPDGWPTIYWSEGAWSAVRGYPAAMSAFEQRVWCGFTSFQTQRIWGTQINDIENWDLGDQTLATDSVVFDLDAVGDGAICWMQAQDSLFIGMVQAEWIVARADATNAISPTNITAHRQSRWGSNVNIPAIVVGDALVFAQRQAFSVRQMLYSVVTAKYMSQDLTALSEQIMNGGALQLTYQKQGNKNGFLWATTANGELVAMTYELDQEVFGWSRHYTGLGIDAGFESVCSISGKGTADDEVWVVVKRMVNGQAVRYVERINPVNWQTVIPQPGQTPGYGADKNQAFYVDAGITYVNPTSNVFGGLSHLAGRTVAVCINALDYGRFTVTQNAGTFITGNTYQIISVGTTDFTLVGAAANTVGLTFVATGPGSGSGAAGGDITVPDFQPDPTVEIFANIGLPFTSTIQPMNLDVDVHTGVTQGIKKKVTGVFIALLNTLGCKVGDGVRYKELIFRQASSPLGEIPLYSDTYEVRDFAGEYGLKIPVIIFTDGPLPLTVLGVAVSYNPSGTP